MPLGSPESTTRNWVSELGRFRSRDQSREIGNQNLRSAKDRSQFCVSCILNAVSIYKIYRILPNIHPESNPKMALYPAT